MNRVVRLEVIQVCGRATEFVERDMMVTEEGNQVLGVDAKSDGEDR